MTRINIIPVQNLTDQHLHAERREIKMIPTALRRSLRTKPVDIILRSIPSRYTLNAGHVTFFYNKMKFLTDRYKLLSDELLVRSYNLSKLDIFEEFMEGIPELFKIKDWNPNLEEQKINIDRILLRISQKPDWYKYHGKKLTQEFYEKYKLA